jgi:hypothetical protein
MAPLPLLAASFTLTLLSSGLLAVALAFAALVRPMTSDLGAGAARMLWNRPEFMTAGTGARRRCRLSPAYLGTI